MNDSEETLDPEDWGETRALAHRMVDDAVDYLSSVAERPVWQPMPEDVRAALSAPLPERPEGLEAAYGSFRENVLPYPMGNIHPRYWMWYMGSGSFSGALADFLAAVMDSNVGGGSHAATMVDLQVVDWCRQMVGFPDTASGTLVSGGSMANFIGLAVARNRLAGVDVREFGVTAIDRPLVFYASDQVHSCHQRSLEALGLGNRALRRIPSDSGYRLDIGGLESAIAADREAGLAPACVIASAGTVNTGAIDDLEAIAALCDGEGLWFHVDGCIGALLAIAPRHRHLVRGLERADSVALDPHKWLHAPFEIGCAIVRDAKAHMDTFSLVPEYLTMAERGVASANWLLQYSLQTSRGFKALKVWMTLKQYGVEKFGRLIDQNIDQARYLSELIEAADHLELVTPTALNIVNFRFDSGGLDDEARKRINVEIMLRMQENGSAAISDTTLREGHCLRVAINNHRTRRSDLDLLVEWVQDLGRQISTGA